MRSSTPSSRRTRTGRARDGGPVTDILVRGKRVLPAKAVAAGYQFRFPALEPALRDILQGEPGE